MMRHSRIQQLIEILAVLFLFFHTLWHLVFFERSTFLVFLSFFTLFCVFVYSVILHWRGFSFHGFRLDNLAASLKATLIPLLTFSVICIVILIVKGKAGRWPAPREFITFFLWGTFQQWIVQGYFLLRYNEIFKNKWISILLATCTFSLFHVPNVTLMLITFLGGLYMCLFFYKWRNIFSVGFIHGMISLTLILTLKPAHVISDNYRVGPDPLGPTRKLITESLGSQVKVMKYLPSTIPSSVFEHFDERVYIVVDANGILNHFESEEPFVAFLTENDYREFSRSASESSYMVWPKALMWRRNFKNDKIETLKCILTLDWKRLDSLYRQPVVVISNRAPPTG
jgi:hypothetical protein